MAEERTINDWVEVFHKLYEVPDSKRPPHEIWIGAVAHFSTMGEAIRRFHFDALLNAATHGLCWMCSFLLRCKRDDAGVFRLSEDFSDLVALKYPGVCGHCRESPCHCKPVAMDGDCPKDS